MDPQGPLPGKDPVYGTQEPSLSVLDSWIYLKTNKNTVKTITIPLTHHSTITRCLLKKKKAPPSRKSTLTFYIIFQKKFKSWSQPQADFTNNCHLQTCSGPSQPVRPSALFFSTVAAELWHANLRRLPHHVYILDELTLQSQENPRTSALELQEKPGTPQGGGSLTQTCSGAVPAQGMTMLNTRRAPGRGPAAIQRGPQVAVPAGQVLRHSPRPTNGTGPFLPD